MRTTIRIDDDLYRAVKEEAARTARTVGELIEDAVRQALRRGSVEGGDLPELPVHLGSGLMPGVDLDDSKALRTLMDEGVGVDALR
ncbi:MAG: CopG family transcriptional regulator [Acidimicrobiia bacterium]|nr:CopG family transcriptional regulator [Acidimicrobiia bacterium]